MRGRAVWVIAIALLHLLSGAATAEDANRWLPRHWGTADGLPVDSVYGMLQGRDGYLWLATLDGLVRFDGVRFLVLRSADHPELPSDRLTTLFEDRRGNLGPAAEAHLAAAAS